MDLIDRQALLETIENYKQYYCGRGWDLKIHDEMCDFAHNVVADAPTVEPKRGEWVEVESYQITGRCSCCGWEAHLYEDDVTGMNYCPNCGADMRGEKND